MEVDPFSINLDSSDLSDWDDCIPPPGKEFQFKLTFTVPYTRASFHTLPRSVILSLLRPSWVLIMRRAMALVHIAGPLQRVVQVRLKVYGTLNRCRVSRRWLKFKDILCIWSKRYVFVTYNLCRLLIVNSLVRRDVFVLCRTRLRWRLFAILSRFRRRYLGSWKILQFHEK